MSDDIVKRLRRRELGDYSVLLCEEAADEIERLRRNTGCARNQRSTQFCAEAMDAQRDVETLKAELVRNADEFRETLTELRQRVETFTAERELLRSTVTDCRIEIERLTAERDEARRELDSARQTIFQLRTKLAACCRTPSSETTLGDGETFIPEAL
jgi:uncharacterized coiled-coil DUF342 family protein